MMRKFQLGLTTEVVINIVVLMLVAVGMISLVVIKLTGEVIVRERFQGLKSQVTMIAQALGPLLESEEAGREGRVTGVIKQMEIPGLLKTGVSGSADLRFEDGIRVLVVGPDLSLLAARAGTEGMNVREEDRPLLHMAMSRKKVEADIQRPGSPGIAQWLDIFPAGLIRVAAPVASHQRIVGGVLVECSLRGITGSIFRILRVIVFYLILDTVLIALLGIYLIVRLAVRPLKVLIGATEKVAGGNLKVKVPVAGPAEVRALADSFNQMVEKIGRAQEQLISSQQQIVQSEKLASVGRMAAGLAHELGNPLGALIGYVHVLLKENGLSPEHREILEHVRDEGLRMDRTIKSLLEFARPAPPHIQECDANQVAARSVALIQGRNVAREVDFRMHYDPDIPPAKGDPVRLEQVLVNLLMNSVDALQEKAPPREVEVATSTSRGWVHITVRDNGPGIPFGDMGKIFDPFFTTKPSDRGTGLGLTVSLQMVRSMEGSLTVESPPGAGTCFTIRLVGVGKRDS